MELSYLTVSLLCVVGFLLWYVYYMSSNHGLFKKLGVATPFAWPVMGTMMQEMGKEGLFNYHKRMYEKYKKDKVYGLYRANAPTMIICDLDMIREICVKQFHNFVNRNTFDLDGPIGHALTELKGDHWKDVRAIVSPSFNTSRLKRLFPHIESNAKLLLEHLKEKQETNEPVELRDLMGAFTMDTIASTGFGVEVNSLKGETEFTKQGKALLNNNARFIFIAIFCKFIRPLLKLLGISMFDKQANDFFTKFVDQALEARKHDTRNTSGRSDFIQLMLDAEKEENSNGSKKGLSYDDIRGQAMIFLLAGFDTTATALSFTLFYLAMNPECREKAQEEVDRVLEGKFPNYESAQGLTYLEMCINEAMRIMPPGFILDRVVENDCEIMGVKIPKGISVTFPVCAIHNDPEIWEKPEQFDPERFTAENKANRHPYAFLPFGQGPRNCIGMRLALLELKVALASILQTLVPTPCEKTVYPPVLQAFDMRAVDGLWVKMEART